MWVNLVTVRLSDPILSFFFPLSSARNSDSKEDSSFDSHPGIQQGGFHSELEKDTLQSSRERTFKLETCPNSF